MEIEKTLEKPVRSVSHTRIIKCYPPPKYHVLLMGYLSANEMKKSEGVSEIIKDFFDKMDPKRKQVCLNEGIKLTRSKHHY